MGRRLYGVAVGVVDEALCDYHVVEGVVAFAAHSIAQAFSEAWEFPSVQLQEEAYSCQH